MGQRDKRIPSPLDRQWASPTVCPPPSGSRVEVVRVDKGPHGTGDGPAGLGTETSDATAGRGVPEGGIQIGE